jgi:hypothetical protein
MEREEIILDYKARDFYLPASVQAIFLRDPLLEKRMPAVLVAHLTLREWAPGKYFT